MKLYGVAGLGNTSPAPKAERHRARTLSPVSVRKMLAGMKWEVEDKAGKSRRDSE